MYVKSVNTYLTYSVQCILYAKDNSPTQTTNELHVILFDSSYLPIVFIFCLHVNGIEMETDYTN